MKDMIESARYLLDHGLTLIKLQDRSKRPSADERWADVGYGKGFRPEDFKGHNIGVKCGEELPGGGFLFVVDIDPRNDGFRAWQVLASELEIPETPDTMTVETGGGGLHFYFRSSKPLRKQKLGIGIDGLGVGAYCVGPGSMHESGQAYLIKIDDAIAAIPEALEKHIAEHEKPFFDGKTGHFIEAEEITEGSRNGYLTSVAGAMRRYGLSELEILAAIKVTNATKCKPPLDEQEVMRIAKSVSRYEPEEPIEVEPTPEEEMPKNESGASRVELTPTLTSTPNFAAKAKRIDQEFDEILAESQGLVRDISLHILKHADRQYPQAAIGAALAIIATVTQGSYRVPSLGRGMAKGSLTGYFWLVAPSAAGKEAYRKAVETYIKAIDDRMLFEKLGSAHGLRASLWCCNSGISVLDEFQDELERLGGQKASPYLMQILTELKELTNDPKELRSVMLSKSRYPAITAPRYSIFAVGTLEGFMRQLTGSMIGGGLLSRFTMWPIEEVVSRSFPDDIGDIPEGIVTRLKALASTGATEVGLVQNYAEEAKRFFEFEDKPGLKHMPQYLATWDLKLTSDAKTKLIDFYASQEKIYKFYLSKQSADSDISPGSVADRAPRFALKAACWHALGCNRTVIELTDVDWAIRVAKSLSSWLCNQVEQYAGDSPFQRLKNRIQDKLSRCPDEWFNRRMIHQFLGGKHQAREVDFVLDTLLSQGVICMMTKEGKIFADEQAQAALKKSAYGARFRFRAG